MSLRGKVVETKEKKMIRQVIGLSTEIKHTEKELGANDLDKQREE